MRFTSILNQLSTHIIICRSLCSFDSCPRKIQPTWTEQVRVNPENGLEGPTDDGYSWRKYGQKDILGAKYPRSLLFSSLLLSKKKEDHHTHTHTHTNRANTNTSVCVHINRSYYRCTYRVVQNCWATKQVQRSDDDPTVFEITYKGAHVCNQSTNGVPPPERQGPTHDQALLNLKANLRVNTENLDTQQAPQFSFPSTYQLRDGEEDHYISVSAHLGAYSPLFLSPATSETNYFSPAPHHIINFGGSHNYQHSESDIADIASAHASTTNSPIGTMEFPIDQLDFDTNFPFTTSGFFR